METIDEKWFRCTKKSLSLALAKIDEDEVEKFLRLLVGITYSMVGKDTEILFTSGLTSCCGKRDGHSNYTLQVSVAPLKMASNWDYGVNVVFGLAIHEIGHVLFPVVNEFSDKFAKTVMNIYEDCYMERRVCDTYPGYMRLLSASRLFFGAMTQQPRYSGKMRDLIIQYLTYRVLFSCVRATFSYEWDNYATLMEKMLRRKLNDGKFTELMKLVNTPNLSTSSSTYQTVRGVLRILKELNLDKKEDLQDYDEDKSENNGDDKSEESNGGDGNSDKKDKSSGKDDKEESPEGKSDENGKESQGDKSDDSVLSESTRKTLENSDSYSDGDASDIYDHLDSMTKKAISKIADNLNKELKDYLKKEEETDGAPSFNVEIAPTIENVLSHSEYKTDYKSLSRKLIPVLTKISRNSGRLSESYGMDEGEIDEDELPTVRCNRDIFINTRNGMGYSSEMIVLQDLSGSMCGDTRIPDSSTMLSALIDAYYMNPCVEFRAYGFSGQGHGYKDSVMFPIADGKISKKNALSYASRILPLDQNIDYDVLLKASEMFGDGKHDKLIIMLSDGAPAAAKIDSLSAMKRVRDVVDSLRDKGIRVVSVGVGDFTEYQKKMYDVYFPYSRNVATDLVSWLRRNLKKVTICN